MIKLGFLIDKPDRSQRFYQMAKEINKVTSIDNDIIVFYYEMGRILTTTKFAMMEMSKCLKYDGILISTCVQTTRALINNQNASQKYFYVQDLEWINNNLSFKENNEVYNSEIELIAPSVDYANIIERVWKKPIAIIEGFNYEQLTNIR